MSVYAPEVECRNAEFDENDASISKVENVPVKSVEENESSFRNIQSAKSSNILPFDAKAVTDISNIQDQKDNELRGTKELLLEKWKVSDADLDDPEPDFGPFASYKFNENQQEQSIPPAQGIIRKKRKGRGSTELLVELCGPTSGIGSGSNTIESRKTQRPKSPRKKKLMKSAPGSDPNPVDAEGEFQSYPILDAAEQPQNLSPLPASPPPPPLPATGHCDWSFDAETGVLLAKFVSSTITLVDERFLLEMMERDDITVVICACEGARQSKMEIFVD